MQRYGWDRAAAKYEQYWTTQLHPAQTRLLEMAALTPGEGVLDVACGTGLVTFPAAHAVGSTGTVLGIDISDGMVDRLRFSATTLGLTQVTAARMDAERLTLPDDTFDVALNALGLMYVSDPVMSLREVWHVLRPGGRGVAAVWGMRKLCGWAEIFPIVDRRVESEVCPLFFQLGTGDALRHAFEAAGFADIVVERITTTLEYATGDDACAAAFVGGRWLWLTHGLIPPRVRRSMPSTSPRSISTAMRALTLYPESS